MLGDTAYEGDGLRQELDQRGTKPVIPNHPNRKHPLSFNKRLYKLRWRIESAFNRLKDFRRIATRYDGWQLQLPTNHWPRHVARKTVVLDASRKVHGRILSGSTTTMSRGLINHTTPTMKPSGKRP
jgi:hypothetical protein